MSSKPFDIFHSNIKAIHPTVDNTFIEAESALVPMSARVSDLDVDLR